MIEYALTLHDFEYRDAVNCTHTGYFHPPMTIVINGVKLILTHGTSERLYKVQQGDMFYIVGTHTGLNYISMSVIDLRDLTDVQTVFMDSNDLDEKDSDLYGILDKETEEQIKILSNWLQY